MGISVYQTKTFEKPYLLIVEGKDDKNFFEVYLDYISSHPGSQILKDTFDVHSINGKSNLSSELEAICKTSGFNNIKSLAIIRDANSDPRAALQSIKSALRNVGLPVPNNPMELSGEKPKVLILLLPDSTQPGMLEDLCLESVKDDLALDCVDNYFKCLHDKRIDVAANLSKAKCLAFLASRPDLPNNIGLAAKQRVWNFNSPVFEIIKKCLMSLIQS